MSRRPRGVVAAGHELTARAAETVLREGGNAFDAVLAAMCMACVVEPVLCSLGGGAFLLARPANGRPRVYDAFVHTPARRRPERELHFYPVDADFGQVRQTFHIGLGSVAVPGAAKGLFEIHRDLGSMPLGDIVAPAVAHARDGVELSELQAYIFGVVGSIYTSTPESRAIYGDPSDPRRPVRQGELIRQPEMADALEVLAIEGERLFYEGEIGRSIAELCAAGGGCVTLEDLAAYRVERRDPLETRYRGVRLLTNPPPSSGGILMSLALRLLETVPDLSEFPFGSSGYLELLALVMELTNRARVEARLDEILSRPGLTRLLDDELLERYRREVLGRAHAVRGTTQISLMDAADNVATMTMSNGASSGHIIPRTGIMLNNMLGEADLNSRGFHRWPTDQRLTSMMAPSVLEYPDGSLVATGSGGSSRIRTAILQVLLNLIDHGMSVERAVASPRIFVENGVLNVEGGFDTDRLGPLLEHFPRHELWDELNLFFGGANTVRHDAAGYTGAGDPRRGGVCVTVD